MPSPRFSLPICLCLATLLVSCDDRGVREQIDERLHIQEKLPAVEAEAYGSFSPVPDIVAERVSYATAYDLRVPAIVYRRGDRKRNRGPAIVIVNGHGGDKSTWYAYWAGILYARAGAVVLTYDPIGEFERNHLRQSNTSQHDQLLQPEEMGRRLSGLMVDDVRGAVSYLLRRKDVDHRRIAVLGYSMGSFVAALACSVDLRIHACVLTGGGDLDGPGGYWDSSSKKMCHAIPYRSLQFLGDRGAILYALNAQRGRTLVWNGSDDEVVDISHHGQTFFADLRQRTLALPGVRKKSVFEYGFVPGGGHGPYFLTKPVALWLEKALNFPNWTETDIEGMPETRISEWAAAQGLSVKSLSDAKNEGGILALGNSVPAVNRDLLHALPDSVWDSERRRYQYETWVERAEAAVRGHAP